MSEFSLKVARAGLLLLIASSISLAADPPAPKYVKLVNVATGKVLSVEDDSEENNSEVIVAKDIAVPEPKLPAATTDADKAAQSLAKSIVSKLLIGTKARLWKLEKDGDFFKLLNANGNRALDVADFSRDDGSRIILWDDKTGTADESPDNQRWSWQATAGGANPAGEKPLPTEQAQRIRSKFSSLVLDVDSNGRVVQRPANDKAKSQLWLLIEVRE